MARTHERSPEYQLADSLNVQVFKPPIRSSNIQDARDCRRKFMFRHRWALRPRSYRSAPQIGTYFHEAMHRFTLAHSELEVYGFTNRLYEQVLAGLNEKVDKAGILPWGQTIEKAKVLAYKDHGVGIAMAMWAWRKEPFNFGHYKLYADKQGSFVERTIEVRIPGFVRTFRVKFDLLVEDNDGRIWIVDYKTCSEDTYEKCQLFNFGMQSKLYRLVLWHYLRVTGDEHRLAGIIHHVMKKPTIRVKQKESIDEYITRVGEDYDLKYQDWKNSRDREITGPPFIRSTIPYGNTEVLPKDLRRELKVFDALCGSLPGLDKYYRNDGACRKWNSLCPYFNLCSTSIKHWLPTIDQHYVKITREQEELEQENLLGV